MPLKIDMHSHSHYSRDGFSKPEELLQKAKELGIGLAVTEHNNFDSAEEYKKLNKKFNVPIIFGQEQKVYSEGKFVGELLFYFLQEPIISKDLFEAIDEGKKKGALISIAHPFDFFRKPMLFGFRKLPEMRKLLDAAEVFNARVFFNFVNKRAEKFAFDNKLAFTAGSDSHMVSEFGHAMAVCEADSIEGFRKCLEKRKTTVEGRLSGPLVHVKTTLRNYGIIKNSFERKNY
jgi:predicted metal-dependent phosphoesterase TrpH